MSLEAWILISVLVFLALGFLVVKIAERRDENAFFDRMHNDPEFARRYHEDHKYDDWEDMGYFDGR